MSMIGISCEDIEDIKYSNKELLDDDFIENLVSSFDLIVISDYCKGFISDEIIKKIIKVLTKIGTFIY